MLVIIMGIPGTGKTSLSNMICEEFGYQFYDMDDSFPEEFRERMRNNELISDEERDGFINSMIDEFNEILKIKPGIAAALVLFREKHRKLIKESVPNTHIFRLVAPTEVLINRLKNRKDHFFKEGTLRKAIKNEDPIEVEHDEINVDRPINDIYEEIREKVIVYSKLE